MIDWMTKVFCLMSALGISALYSQGNGMRQSTDMCFFVIRTVNPIPLLAVHPVQEIEYYIYVCKEC